MKIIINGDAVDIPVGNSGIPTVPLTQAEYDALTDEEKNAEKLYLITDAAASGSDSGGSSEEVYSTEETRIGTWVNGQPIYRKTMTAVLPSSITNGTSVQLANWPLNMDLLVHGYGSITTTNSQELPLPFFSSDVNYAFVFYNKADHASAPNSLRCTTVSGFSSCRLRYTLEYTKTTDAATRRLTR